MPQTYKGTLQEMDDKHATVRVHEIAQDTVME